MFDDNNMKHTSIVVAVAIVSGVFVNAASQPVNEADVLRKSVAAQLDEYFTSRETARSAGSAREIEAARRLDPLLIYGERIVEFARSHPDEMASFELLSFVIDWGEGVNADVHSHTWDELLTHHANNPALSWACFRSTNWVSYFVSREKLEKLFQVSSSNVVRGSAALALAILADNTLELSERSEYMKQKFSVDGRSDVLPMLQAISELDVSMLRSDRARWLDTVRRSYYGIRAWDCTRDWRTMTFKFSHNDNGRSLGLIADDLQYTVDHLKLGAKAPDVPIIDNSDSTRAGKIRATVVLFSGKGCRTCDEFFPVLNELRGEYGGDELRIVGIMTDYSDTEIERARATKKMLWPCVNDRDGALVRAFRIRYYPSVFLIDAGGVIRATWEVTPKNLREKIIGLSQNVSVHGKRAENGYGCPFR